MQAFDASTLIHAWENYPNSLFPGLWEWISDQIQEKELILSEVAFSEVKKKSPDCIRWLDLHEMHPCLITNSVIVDAARIAALLGIMNDNYGGGVGPNDILIIASARAFNAQLVSEEALQRPILPHDKRNYKIPAVCQMREVGVSCIKFIDYLITYGREFR